MSIRNPQISKDIFWKKFGGRLCEAYPPVISMIAFSTSGTSPGMCVYVPKSAAWGPGLIAGDRHVAWIKTLSYVYVFSFQKQSVRDTR